MKADCETTCSLCGAGIPAAAPGGQCPKCLLGFGLDLGESHHGVSGAPGNGHLLSAVQVRYFGDYILESEIARGGMGVVYRARQRSLDRPVAIKMILSGQLASPESVARFRLEAQAAANLDHPHIISIFEIGEHETQHYFSMKLVEGARPVSVWAAEAGPGADGQRRIAAMMEKIARAVAYAHERGILHRDLKPTNILIGRDGEPQVMDFGLAKLVGETGSNLTLSTTVLGSPAYMAPEQAMGDREVTTAADVYGLGAVLYEVLADVPPFEGESPVSVLRKVQEEMPRRPSLRRPDIARDLERVCMKCLAKDPRDRYRSAADLADDLGRFGRGEPVSALPLTPGEQLWRWCKRNPVVSALSSALMVALAVGFVGVSVQRNRAERSNVDLRRSIAQLEWREIDRWLERGEAQRAVAYLASVLRREPDRWQAAQFAASILEQHPAPLICGPRVPAEPVGSGAIAFHPEGTAVAMGSGDGTVRTMDVGTGEAGGPSRRLGSVVTSLAFDPGGRWLAACDAGGRCVLFALDASGDATVRDSGGPNGELRFSADGSRLFLRDGGGIRAWRREDLAAGRMEGVLLRSAGGITGWDVSASGRRVFARNGPERFVVWDADRSDILLAQELPWRIRHGAISGNGERVVVGSRNEDYEVWDIDSGAPVARRQLGTSSLSYADLDPGGQRVLLASRANWVQAFDVGNGRPAGPRMRSNYDYRGGILPSPDHRFLLTGSIDDLVRVWRLDRGEQACEPVLTDGEPLSLAWSRDGTRFLVRTGDGPAPGITVWKRGTRREPEMFVSPGDRYLAACRTSPDGRWVALGAWHPAPRAVVFDRASGEIRHSFELEGDAYAHLFHPVRDQYIVVTNRGWIYSRALEDGRELWKPIDQGRGNIVALLTRDGKFIVTAGTDGNIRVYRSGDGSLVREMEQGGHVAALSLMPDDRGLLCGTKTGDLAVWDLETGEKRLAIDDAHAEPINAVDVTRDGTRILSAAYDKTVKLWRADTGRPLCRPMEHLSELSHAEFSPDGTRLASAARDGTARIWDARTGAPLSAWMDHDASAETVRFTPEGKRLVVRHLDGFRLWDAWTGEPISVSIPFPAGGGLGFDSPTVRDILSPDGSEVRLGGSADAGSIWDISLPPTPAPDWFPDFLEAVCRLRLGSGGVLSVVPAGEQLALVERFRNGEDGGWYADFARRVLGISEK